MEGGRGVEGRKEMLDINLTMYAQYVGDCRTQETNKWMHVKVKMK